MPLTFDYANVPNKDVVCTDPSDPDKYHPVLDAIVWLSLVCGYSSITQKNALDVAQRIAQYEAVSGAFLTYRKDGRRIPAFITLNDVHRYVGLRLNSSSMTKAQWHKKLAGIALSTGERNIKEQNTTAYDIVDNLANVNSKEKDYA